MKPKNTLILLILAGAIFAFIYFVENKMPTSQKAAERAGKVVEFNRDKITSITIKNTDTEIDLTKGKDGAWMMEKPVKDRADSMAITQLFTDSESLKSDAIVGDSKKGAEKDQLKEFGLSNPETKLTLVGDEKPVTILFGKDAAVEGKLYVRLDGSNVVHVIGNTLKTQVTKKADDFRDHKLTELTSTKVDKVTFKTGGGEIEAEKKDQHWALTQPLKARGDDQKIGDIISQIANAKVDSFVADSSNLSALGLQEPRATFTLHSEGDEKPVALQIGQAVDKDKNKDKIYVKLSSRESALVVPKSIGDLADTKPNDLRDRKLVRVESDIVDRMTIESPGKDKIVLARKGEKWVRKEADKDVPINSAAAKKLLEEVQSERVVDFVSDLATELPKYGLDQPRVKLTLSSYASENTAETKAGEKPIVSILFGKSEGANVYAKLDDEPFVVSVSKSILDAAMTDPLQWQELAIYRNAADDILSAEVTRQGQAPVAIERNKDKKWAFAKGDGKINETNAESLVNTLAKLTAVRWAGPNAPEFGLDKPTLTITFKTASNPNGKLTLGVKSTDELTYATAEGLTGVFALSRPDVSALELPLQAGAPAPATLPPGTPEATAPTPPAPVPPTPMPSTQTPPAPTSSTPAPPSPAPSTPAPPLPAPSTPAPPVPAPPVPAPPVPAPPVPAPPVPAPPVPAPPVPAPPVPAPATPAPAPATPTPPAPATPEPAAPANSTPASPAPSSPTPSAPASTPANSPAPAPAPQNSPVPAPNPSTPPAPAPSSPPSAPAPSAEPAPAPGTPQPGTPSSEPSAK